MSDPILIKTTLHDLQHYPARDTDKRFAYVHFDDDGVATNVFFASDYMGERIDLTAQTVKEAGDDE